MKQRGFIRLFHDLSYPVLAYRLRYSFKISSPSCSLNSIHITPVLCTKTTTPSAPKMPAATTPPPIPVPFSVPTIDISPYLSSPYPESPECLKIINAVRTACTTTGFFQLVGHGISKELQARLFKGAEQLFKLPMEEKKKLDRGQSVGASNRGYELIGGQGLQEGTLPDLKEVSLEPLVSSSCHQVMQVKKC